MASTAAMRAAAPRQCQLLGGIKESFEHAVQRFWNALKQGARKPSGASCMPSLIRRNGHLSSLVSKIATWPRLASRMSRERSSPNPVQPGSCYGNPGAAAGCRRYSLSFPGPGLPSASLTVPQPRTKYSSNIFKASRRQTPSSSERVDSQEELTHAAGTSTVASENSSPIYIASPDSDASRRFADLPWLEDDFLYMLKGVSEDSNYRCTAPALLQHGDTWFENLLPFDCEALVIPCSNSEAEQYYRAGDSSVSTSGTASSAASQELLLQEPAAAAGAGAVEAAPAMTHFRGIRQKENKWIAEIRPSCSKRTVWLGTYKTPEEAARAYDVGIYYYQKFSIPFNFPDSPRVLPAINEGPKEVSTKFVKTEARRNAERVWTSPAAAACAHQLQKRLASQQQQQQASSSDSSRGWSLNPCKKKKTNSRQQMMPS